MYHGPTFLLVLLLEDLHKKSFKSVKSKPKGQLRKPRSVLKDITNIAHLRQINSHSPSKSEVDGSTHSIDEDDEIVGNDLFGGTVSKFLSFYNLEVYTLMQLYVNTFTGIIHTDHQQVFDCSSPENSDTENDESEFDDSIDEEVDVLLNNGHRKQHDLTEPGGVLKLRKPSKINFKDTGKAADFILSRVHWYIVRACF
ncbi:unnamed protein product [Eruca vesicaria subsp. sativa]|uniref:Uncharacterized protein n=1 Tax=Eruca vesicaria subsp. sativa TaxID=29727 RepID=A0ABC8J479_ERUVS|nr:unnamed protein product [Eruca vesicaria subsp. sativa]